MSKIKHHRYYNSKDLDFAIRQLRADIGAIFNSLIDARRINMLAKSETVHKRMTPQQIKRSTASAMRTCNEGVKLMKHVAKLKGSQVV